MRTRRIALIGALLALAIPASASAAPGAVEVTTNADNPAPVGECTLRDALASTEVGNGINNCNFVAGGTIDRITFAPSLSGQTIELSAGDLSINASSDELEITGPGMNSLTISAADNQRVLTVSNGVVDIHGMTVRDGVIAANGQTRGGCILVQGTLNLTDVHVTNCTVTSTGTADQFADGAGIGSTGVLRLTDSLVDANQATALNSATDANVAQARGAGIFSDIGAFVGIEDSVIRDNTATATDGGTDTALAAGGLFAAQEADILTSTISGNTATATHNGTGAVETAGGAYLAGQNGLIELSTIAGNVGNPSGSAATYHAGGVNSRAESTSIRSSTIALNGPTIGTLDGVNLFVPDGDTEVVNTIIADPRGDGLNCLAVDAGTLTSDGFNVDYSPDPDGPSCFIPAAATDLTSNPLLHPDGVEENGGPTPTIALQPTSPVIDKGDSNFVTSENEDRDQRGFTRPVDFSGIGPALGGNDSDIGAFELQLACAGQATPSASCEQPATPAGPTGQRAAALKKCKKKKTKKKRKKCRKKARKLPV
jgi:hypothetical protein